MRLVPDSWSWAVEKKLLDPISWNQIPEETLQSTTVLQREGIVNPDQESPYFLSMGTLSNAELLFQRMFGAQEDNLEIISRFKFEAL